MEENAVICAGCDFILDTEFLGDGILDEEHRLRPGTGGVDPAAFNLADAVILGNIDDQSASFETSDSGFHLRSAVGARLYVSGRSQAMMSPDAVPALVQAPDGLRLTPFERHVLSFIDGKRPVEVIRKQAGLEESEVKTALATLADKGVVKVIGRALAEDLSVVDETAPKRVPRPRLRGSAVGAVALVGDEADAAIEDAFRTQVGALNASELQALRDGRGGTRGRGIRAGAMASVVSSEGAAAEDGAAADLVPIPPPRSGRSISTSQGTLPLPADPPERAGASFDETGPVRPHDEYASLSEPPSAVRPLVEHHAHLVNSGFVHRPDALLSGGADSAPPAAAPIAPVGLARGAQRTGTRGAAGPTPAGARAYAPPLASASFPNQDRSPHASGGRGPVDSSAGDRRPTDDLLDAIDDAPSVELERVAASGHVWDDPPTNTRKLDDDEAQALAPLPEPPPTDALSSSGALPARPPPRAPEPAAAQAAIREAERAARALHDARDSTELPTHGGAGSPALRSAQVQARGDNAHPNVPRPQADEIAARVRDAVARHAPGDLDPQATDFLPHRGPPPRPAPALSEHDDLSVSSAVRGARSQLASDPGSLERSSNDASAGDDARDPADDDALHSDPQLPAVAAAPRRAAPPTVRVEALAAGAGRANARPAAQSPIRQAPPSAEGTGSVADRSLSSGVELVDSALLIRPAASAPGLGAAVALARQRGMRGAAAADRSESAPAHAFPEASRALQESLDDGAEAPSDGERQPASDGSAGPVSSERTVNFDRDEAQRVIAGGGVRAHGAILPIPSGISQVIADPNARAPSAEMRKKGQKLFDEAQREYEQGRLAAARMNARLASIYDPSNATYAQALEAWDGTGQSEGHGDAHAQGSDANAPEGTNPADPGAGGASSDQRADLYAMYDEAQALEEAGEIDAALDALHRGLAMQPNAAAFHNKVGVLLAMRKRDFEAAAAAIQRAIDLDPNNLHYRNNLGKVVTRLKPRAEAT